MIRIVLGGLLGFGLGRVQNSEKVLIRIMNRITFQNAIIVALLMIVTGVAVALFRSVTLNTRFWDELRKVANGCLKSSQFLALQGAIAVFLGYAFFYPREHPLLSVFALALGIYGIACAGGSVAFWAAQGFYRGRDAWEEDHRDRLLEERVRADELTRMSGQG